MKTRKGFKLALWIISGVILLLGLIQIISFLPGPLEAMRQAQAQGVTQTQISKFFWQQVVPQLLSYAISVIGPISILFFVGALYEKAEPPVPQKQLPSPSPQQEKDMDDFLDEFEVVRNENN